MLHFNAIQPKTHVHSLMCCPPIQYGPYYMGHTVWFYGRISLCIHINFSFSVLWSPFYQALDSFLLPAICSPACVPCQNPIRSQISTNQINTIIKTKNFYLSYANPIPNAPLKQQNLALQSQKP